MLRSRRARIGDADGPRRARQTPQHRPVAVRALAHELARTAWHAVTWRPGTRGPMRSRFACVRVRPAHRDTERAQRRAEETLVIEWPRDEAEPTKYWLSTLPADTPLAQLVRLVKIRWRIERDYEELKSEFGLDHFEGRSWRGFHHHGSLCIAAYAFLAAERARLSPLRLCPSSTPLAYPAVSSRGALPVRAARHVRESITTLRLVRARALLQHLPCLACGHPARAG